MKKVLLIQQSLDPPGGGIAVGAWVAQTLVESYDVTLLVWRKPDWQKVNHYYGTHLDGSQFRIIEHPRLLRWLRPVTPMPLALAERYFLMRMARRIADEFDLVISTTNEFDVLRPMVQYIHFPWGYWPRPNADMKWYHLGPLLKLYYAAAAKLAPVSAERIAGNRTLVNSAWTGERFREKYGGEITVLPPPVSGCCAPLPWDERDDTFVIAGRLSGEKRIPEVMQILERVRSQSGRDVRMVVTGSRDRFGKSERVFAAAKRRPWVRIVLDLSRDDLLALFGRSRYGIHGMLEEHYGISIAEMVRSGCIVFVPNGGGQVEIVRDARLQYDSDDDAVAKIVRVLGDPALQRELLDHLARQSERMTIEHFQQQVRTIVAEELQREEPSEGGGLTPP